MDDNDDQEDQTFDVDLVETDTEWTTLRLTEDAVNEELEQYGVLFLHRFDHNAGKVKKV
jgi:hypothetical protein